MQPFQQRMIEETEALKEKLSKLDAFTDSHNFAVLPSEEKDLLLLQKAHMRCYLEILRARIARFYSPIAA